jgi:hypothetical protein
MLQDMSVLTLIGIFVFWPATAVTASCACKPNDSATALRKTIDLRMEIPPVKGQGAQALRIGLSVQQPAPPACL